MMIFPLISIASAAIAALTAFDQSYTRYSELLSRHVCENGVNYEALAGDPGLETVASEFAALSRQEFDGYDTASQIAYLINVYNFFTLHLIARNYPVHSINDIERPWDREFVPLFGKNVSLNYVEHKVLRKEYNEPRIHFALNCASIGCPPLVNEPFLGHLLNKQLDAVARAFCTDDSRNSVEKRTLHLSKIFKWYGNDFDQFGGAAAYVKQTLGLSGDYTVKYRKYDWGLNDATGCP